MKQRINVLKAWARNNYNEAYQVRPRYGGPEPIDLDQLLYFTGHYINSDKAPLGKDHQGNYVTLGTFLLSISIPQVVNKSLLLGISDNEPIPLVVSTIFIKGDRLFLNIKESKSTCRYERGILITTKAISLGLIDYPLSHITSVRIEELLWWQR